MGVERVRDPEQRELELLVEEASGHGEVSARGAPSAKRKIANRVGGRPAGTEGKRSPGPAVGQRGGLEAIRYLPPYSPDLNPIEQVFAKLKALLRRNVSPGLPNGRPSA